MTRTLAAIALLFGTVLFPQISAPSAVAAPGCVSGVRGDTDGNGTADLVVGAIRYNSPTHPTDFEVIRFPSEERIAVGVSDVDPSPESGQLERAALADLNADGCADLVFGADDPNSTGKARLYIVPGSPTGLALAEARKINLSADLVQQVAAIPSPTGGQVAVTTRSDKGDQALRILRLTGALTVAHQTVVTASSLGIKTPSNPRFGFGMSLAASGRTIVVGNPNEKVGKKPLVGAVHLFTSTAAKPDTFRHSRITAASPHIPGRATELSSFGAQVDYLDGRLAIAAPDAQIVHKHHYANNAGQVVLLRWNEKTRKYTYVRHFNQQTKGVPDNAESWDRLGYKLLLLRGLTRAGSYDLVASSREGIGSAAVAGSVLVTNFDKGGYRSLTQASPGVPGEVGKDHWFGFELTKRSGSGSDALVIGSLDATGCSNGGIVMQTSGAPLATASWSTVTAESDSLGCPATTWPYSLGRG
jgi:hypothetical protein